MCNDCTWVLRFVNISVILFVIPWVVSIALLLKRRKEGYKPGQSGTVALTFTVGFILSAFFLHYAVGCCKIHHVVQDVHNLTYFEEFVASLFRAVRIVGVPEFYSEFVADLRWMLGLTLPESMIGVHDWIAVAATVMDIAIPIAGSALLLGIFARAFPKVMLFIRSLFFWREKCYFSGLNPQSVALAKSILEARRAENKGKWWRIRPLLVFTDAYVDDEMEHSYELMLEAKGLGAVCVRDDLAHIIKTKRGKRSYFLMEEDEYANMPALMGLVEDRNVPYLKRAAIYLFVGSNLYERLEKNIRQRLMDPKYKLVGDDFPLLVPINAHRNLVNNLMVDVPLYEPLVGTDKTQLSVTILGNGSIGTEAFLSTYWFGQMQRATADNKMVPCDLHVHVVSQDEESTFWDKIDYYNSEIRRTCDASNKILDWSPNKKNPPYASVTYHQANVKMGGMGENKAWLKSHYFIVALGSDADNIAVAEKLRKHIGKRRWEDRSDANTVIAYVVYNTELCRSLNEHAQVEHGVYMYAFGDLEQVYSTQNVFMTQSAVRATQTGNAYNHRNSGAHEQEQKARSSERGNYNYWSSLARVMHITYKIFSLGWITTSLFEDREKHAAEMQVLKRRYARVCGLSDANVAEEDRRWRADLEEKKEHLAYLEHRRWNTFIRSLGYRRSDKRSFSLKLHPCLVETRGPQAADPYVFLTDEKLDYLDALRTPGSGYKVYDYPHYEVGDLVTYRFFVAWNRNEDNTLKVPALDETTLLKLCEQFVERGAYQDDTPHVADWIIPLECLKEWLSNEDYDALTKENG